MARRPNFPKVRASHILLSYDEAHESTHSRGIYFAVWEAKQIINDLKKGAYSWSQAVKDYSACPHSNYMDGDLGWFDLSDDVDSMLYLSIRGCKVGDILDEPVQTDFGVHIITRTG